MSTLATIGAGDVWQWVAIVFLPFAGLLLLVARPRKGGPR
jgi:hypothetical protein